MFSAQRVRATSRRKWRGGLGRLPNLDGSEPRYYLGRIQDPAVGGSRWYIETEFETEKGDVGLDEYETRSWRLACHVPGAERSCDAAGLGEKRCPGSPSASVRVRF